MNLDEIQKRSREVFRVEASDLLGELEEALLALESDPSNSGLIDRAFRVMHTLKGSGATSGFQELSEFLHRVEDVFNAARESRLAITSEIIDRTLRIADAVSRYLAAGPAQSDGVLTAAGGDLAALLACLPEVPTSPASQRPETATSESANVMRRYRIRFRPHAGLFRSGGDPGVFLDDLRALGTCSISVECDHLPTLAELDPESSYLCWVADLSTECEEEAIRAVFAFVEGECELEITQLGSSATNASAPAPAGVRRWNIDFVVTERTLATPGAIEAVWRDLERFGRLDDVTAASPVEEPRVAGPRQWRLETAAPADKILSAFVFLPDADPKIRKATAEGVATSDAAATDRATAEHPRLTRPTPPGNERSGALQVKRDTLRVPSERLDRLVNLVGELVILRSQVSTACAGAANLPPGLQGAAEALQRLSTEMRDVILNIRMMPIEQTFMKFRRIVRDLARDLGKEVELTLEGSETEMDKTVLDALADPLVHLVRNSLDHGLEPAAERVAAGKPPVGKLRLRAEQRGDRVLVSVKDDGRGLDPAKIRAKALAKMLIPADASPTDEELFQLIFLPGFSTAESLSQVSGRGVGLDVVQRQVDQLRGKVEVRSEPGRGVEFRLSMPLTVAIIEGLMVEVDGAPYVLPLGIARETIVLSRTNRRLGNGRNLVQVRGDLIPYVRLRDVFSAGSESPDPERVVVVEIEDQRIGLVVDRVIGNHQTVLKSLGWTGRHVTVFSGATVLGNGRIALVLDVPALLTHHERSQAAASGLET